MSTDDHARKTTLKELKNHLPIESAKHTDQSFTFKDWGMKEEKHITKIKSKNPTMGKFISSVMAYMIDTIHGENFAGWEDKKKLLFINQQPTSNILYMYLYLRYDQLGEDVKMNVKCPFCGHAHTNFVTDIGDIDVDCKTKGFEEIKDYKLRKPITIQEGDILVENVKYTVSKWDVLEKAGGAASTDEGTMKELGFKNSIVGFGDINVAPMKVIEKMRKIDIERLNNEIAQHNGGPTIQAEVDCEKCSQTYWQSINWSYENFFGLGSLPTA